MDAELKSLQIDRVKRNSGEPSKWATRWIIGGVILFLLLGAGRYAYSRLNAATEVEVQRVKSISTGHAEQGIVLNATGYIVAAHKIELAAKVIGKVKWIGVDKGDKVKEGQVLVRLEDGRISRASSSIRPREIWPTWKLILQSCNMARVRKKSRRRWRISTRRRRISKTRASAWSARASWCSKP